MSIFSFCLRAKNCYQSFQSFSPRRGLKVSIAHKMMVQSNLLESRWLKGGGKLDAYLFGLGLCISVCLCVCMGIHFCVLEKFTIHSIWISSCLGKTSSTMDNGISDIWILLEFCFVKIANDVWKGVKFGRNSLLVCNLHDVSPPVSNGAAILLQEAQVGFASVWDPCTCSYLRDHCHFPNLDEAVQHAWELCGAVYTQLYCTNLISVENNPNYF